MKLLMIWLDSQKCKKYGAKLKKIFKIFMSVVTFSRFSKTKKNQYFLIFSLKMVLETSNHVQKNLWSLRTFTENFIKIWKAFKKIFNVGIRTFFFSTALYIFTFWIPEFSRSNKEEMFDPASARYWTYNSFK